MISYKLYYTLPFQVFGLDKDSPGFVVWLIELLVSPKLSVLKSLFSASYIGFQLWYYPAIGCYYQEWLQSTLRSIALAKANAQITTPSLQKIRFIIPASKLSTALGTTKTAKTHTRGRGKKRFPCWENNISKPYFTVTLMWLVLLSLQKKGEARHAWWKRKAVLKSNALENLKKKAPK